MISKLIVAIGLALGAIYMGLQLEKDSGLLLVAFNGMTIETSLTVGIALIILVFCFVYLTLSFLHRVIQLPKTLKQWYQNYKHRKSQALTQKGLIEFSEGYFKKAQNNLLSAAKDTDMPLLNYLTAARCAQELGESALRDDFLRQAQHSTPEAKVAILLTQAQLQLVQRQYEQALATLKHLQTIVPKHPYVLKGLTYLYEEMKDWESLLQLMPRLESENILNETAFNRLQIKALSAYIDSLYKAQQLDKIIHLFDALPRKLRKNECLIAAFVKTQLDTKPIAAEKLLRKSLEKNVSPELVQLYGLIYTTPKQLAFAEKLIALYPHDAALHLCLARLFLKQELTGKAKYHFEKSLELKPCAETYQEYGDLLGDILNDKPNALIAYQKGLAASLG